MNGDESYATFDDLKAWDATPDSGRMKCLRRRLRFVVSDESPLVVISRPEMSLRTPTPSSALISATESS